MNRDTENFMMQKVTLLIACCMLFAVCFSAEAQQPRKIYRIGYLSPRLGFDSAGGALPGG
jgi:hypothetical protein